MSERKTGNLVAALIGLALAGIVAWLIVSTPEELRGPTEESGFDNSQLAPLPAIDDTYVSVDGLDNPDFPNRSSHQVPSPSSNGGGAPPQEDAPGLFHPAWITVYDERIYDGRTTASGETYLHWGDELTAASRFYPMDTCLEVCRRDDSSHCIVVRVNDRMGPGKGQEHLDLNGTAMAGLSHVYPDQSHQDAIEGLVRVLPSVRCGR